MCYILGVLVAFLSIFGLSFATSAYEQEVISLRAPFKPYALVLPVQKDVATNFHVSKIRKRTSQLSEPFLVDLNGKFLQVNCENSYLSSTYHYPFCHSTICARAGVNYCHRCTSQSTPGCHNNSCAIMVRNHLTQKIEIVEIAQNVLSIQALMESQFATIPNFLFACSSPSSLLQGLLPKNVQGMVGLGHFSVSLPNQLASHYGVSPKFSLCLSSSPRNEGAIFFGNVPKGWVSQSPIFTSIFLNSLGEYFILVTSIWINNNLIFNLPSESLAYGSGTILSTTTPYTTMEHSLYQVFKKSFANAIPKMHQVRPVAPFGLCFDTRNFTSNFTNVPNIDFVLQNQNVKWTIGGSNSMVQTRAGVSCLAFVDGGLNPKATIIIGVYQMEDNLLEFDLAKSRLGLIPSRFFNNKTCANFNSKSTLST